jgi:RimJ/RimL family protein N-acetyltransferase
MQANSDRPRRTDLELLALKLEMNLDGSGRLAGTSGVTIAASRDGQRPFIGSEVPETLSPELVDVVGRSPAAKSPDQEPPAVGACRALLTPVCGSFTLEAGPVYAVESIRRRETQPRIVRSDAATPGRLHNPGNWESDEWEDLLTGICGPWAMAAVDDRVVSICHTPLQMTEHAAECGVWTDAQVRGRGYASATIAAWADIVGPTGRRRFYSTDKDNRASQALAAKLGLRPIGWLWRLVEATARPNNRHPLSRPRT